jgi:adenylate cyclase
VTGEPVTSDPVTGEPVTGEPVTSDPVTGEPVTGEPVTGEPVTCRDPGLAGEHEAALARVRAFLIAHGATPEEIARAEADDVLDLLVADCLLVPARRRYTRAELAAMSGMPVDLAQKFWRALGLADVAPEDRAFTELDLEASVVFERMVEAGAVEVGAALQLARVIGSSMARIAEAEMQPAGSVVPGLSTQADSVLEADRFLELAEESLPAMARLLEFVWRRHVQAAARRAMMMRSRGDGSNLPVLCVGFADMVGFTMLSQQLSDDELAAVVSRFEQVAHDTVTSLGGRVVKMIGDEAMFVAESPVAAARIGLSLSEAYADDDLLSDVRVALAVGPVLVHDGDYFGTVVNLASRVVGVANPGSVLVSDEFHQELVDAAGDEFAFVALRPRLLKDLGRVQLWSMYRPNAEPPSVDRRIGSRLERLSEVLRELDDLRERGERLIAGGLRAAVAQPSLQQRQPVHAPARSEASTLGRTEAASAREPHGSDGEWPELERSGNGGDGSAAQVDQPS